MRAATRLAAMDENASWTYKLPPDGGGAAGLEGYGVEASSGTRLGSVYVVLERGGDRLVAVKRGGLLSGHDVRLVRWDDVSFVDHERDVVRLALSADELAGLPRLSRSQGTRAEDADAVRVTGFLSVAGARPAAGPDRADLGVLLAAGLLAVSALTALSAVIFASGHHSPAREYFVLSLLGLLSLGLLAAGFSSAARYRRRPADPDAHGSDGSPAERA